MQRYNLVLLAELTLEFWTLPFPYIREAFLNISSKPPLQNPDLSAYSEMVFFRKVPFRVLPWPYYRGLTWSIHLAQKHDATFVQGYKIKKVFFHYPNFRALPWPYYRESYYFFKLPPQNPNFCPYSEGIFQKHWFKPWHSDLLWGNI